MADHVDGILAQWRRERPDLDVSPMGVIGRLSRAAAAVDAQLARNFAAHDLDRGSFDVLATLLRNGAPHRLTPAALAADAMITSSAVAQRLNRLEARGLITRTPNPEDGRGSLVTLTPAGKAAVEATLPAHLATEEAMLADLTTDERAALATLLSRLLHSAGGR
ncbi:MarR family winged helix-turn-helix transcriptional regulator [Cryptosporangium aurantiacum]|uniref:DNA-binding transcriptional regulator, MarR family n=1 Tax=Cryptosporangium aurantiacum TaxID=134849 RepID=A0A1M7RLD5_9ACTN|nr:MarR family transcriptional regulator [Cryptosporangium aurantiacum]SHN47064.1 DNA-binding transcriptional regulator, MarR family [Cryptosporangium aurantiacum]